MLSNGMYNTKSTLCSCQNDGLYVDMMFSCLNVFYAVLVLLELSCIQCVSGTRCFSMVWYALHNIRYR